MFKMFAKNGEIRKVFLVDITKDGKVTDKGKKLLEGLKLDGYVEVKSTMEAMVLAGYKHEVKKVEEDFEDEEEIIYEDLTVAELKDICKEKGITIGTKNKEELIEAILETE